MELFNILPIVFPFYDKIEKQNRFRENARNVKEFHLIAPNDSLLPFQIKKPINNPLKPTEWKVVKVNSIFEYNLTHELNKISGRNTEIGSYLIYFGDELKFKIDGNENDFKLENGLYYSVLTFPNGEQYFSETFCVYSDLSEFLKIEFYNEKKDLKPILNSDANGRIWAQKLYVNSLVYASEPEIETDGERNEKDEIVPTFSKLTITYMFQTIVSDYLKSVFVALKMYDTVYLETANKLNSGYVGEINTETSIEENGAISTVDVSMKQIIITSNSCEEIIPNYTTESENLSEKSSVLNYRFESNGKLISDVSSKVLIVSVKPNELYYFQNWKNKNKIGFYSGLDNVNLENLNVISFENASKIGSAFWKTSPINSTFVVIELDNQDVNVYENEPGKPILKSINKKSNSTIIKGFAPVDAWNDVYFSTSQNEDISTNKELILSNISSDQIEQGFEVNKINGFIFIESLNYSKYYGVSNKISLT